MVSAIQGVLLTCDVPLKQILLALNDAQEGGDKFVIAQLDDGNLFIKADKADWVQQKVKDHCNSLHYEPAHKEQEALLRQQR